MKKKGRRRRKEEEEEDEKGDKSPLDVFAKFATGSIYIARQGNGPMLFLRGRPGYIGHGNLSAMIHGRWDSSRPASAMIHG